MNKRIKNILLSVIATIGLISLFVRGSDEQKPYIIKEGTNTVLIPGSLTLFSHYVYNLESYKKLTNYEHFFALNNIPIFNSTGEIVVTLDEVRKAFNPKENKDDNILKFTLVKWLKVRDEINSNNAVVCPNIVPQQYNIKENIQWFFTGKEKEKVPAIVVGTRDCGVCKQIEEYYKK